MTHSEIDTRLSVLGLFIQREHPLHEPVIYYIDYHRLSDKSANRGRQLLDAAREKGIDPAAIGKGAKQKVYRLAEQIIDLADG